LTGLSPERLFGARELVFPAPATGRDVKRR
jgi:hypothetical protein